MNKPYLKRKFYGRRKGKTLTKKRAELIESLLPQITLPFAKGGPAASINPNDYFDSDKKEVWMEIGFGDGAHLAEQARTHPEIGFIGCEPFMNGVAGLLCEIDDDNIKNIQIWPDDARDVMDALADETIGRLFLLHPDPWPKTRHHKRRFIQDTTVEQLARILKKGGQFRVATDDQDLCDWMLYHINKSPYFEWTAECAEDWRTPPDDWPVTRYGEKQLAGIPVYLTFARI